MAAASFVPQRSLQYGVQRRSVRGEATPLPRVRSTAEWLTYFRANAARRRPIPWEVGGKVNASQLAAIATSLQGWQLGETSEGRHLRRPRPGTPRSVGDPDLPAVIDLFIREEQYHGELLGRFLDLSGPGRVRADWGDSLFRAARYSVTNMEVWTTPVVMVETLAVIYYNAVRRATDSPVLRVVCANPGRRGAARPVPVRAVGGPPP